MTIATKPTRTFRSQRPDDPEAQAGQAIRDVCWTMFSRFAEPGATIDDLEILVTRIREATGWRKSLIENAICGHAQLQNLPQLRELQAETRIMDLNHIAAIDEVLRELGPDVPEGAFSLFDDALVDAFTPKRNNQNTPLRQTITSRLRKIIKLLDPARAYDPNRRRQRCGEPVDEVLFDTLLVGGAERNVFQLTTDAVTALNVREHLLATARDHKVSLAEAAVKLLTGAITPDAKPTLYLYAPKGRQPGEPAYLPGCGWTSPEDTAVLDEWLSRTEPKLVDLDQVRGQTTTAYRPTPAMRAAAAARDGTCIYPGCSIAAERCQLDHRVPFDEGGPTTVDNLYSLCARHHNLKTDRRAIYIPDPDTGEVVWLFANGTYETATMDGFLAESATPVNPRWRRSLEQAMRHRAIRSEFHAKGHAILDQFDVDGDLETADARIAALEDEYGLEFPVKAVLPDPEPAPPEPYLDEPPFPDPENPDPKPDSRRRLEACLRTMRPMSVHLRNHRIAIET